VTSRQNTLIKTNIYFIVDDDVDDQQFLIDALVENDPYCRCFTASNGAEAIAHLTDAVVPIPEVRPFKFALTRFMRGSGI
jgi:hypothetical protein